MAELGDEYKRSPHPMTDERTPEARLLALAEKATPGPWEQSYDNVWSKGGDRWVCEATDGWGTSEYLAACDPDTISKLCRVVEAARKVWNEAIDHRYSDEFIGQRFRSVVGNALIDMDDTP